MVFVTNVRGRQTGHLSFAITNRDPLPAAGEEKGLIIG
jgi:hypothetical protein